MHMENIFEIDKKYIADTYARFPVQITCGKGSRVKDVNGKEYIDLGTGIAVNIFGIADDEWIKAVTDQLSKFQHTSNLYYSEPCARLAEAICKRTGMSKVFFSNSGAEANECAIKAARKYAADKKGADHYTIITLKNSFHGRTITTLAATGQDSFHQMFLPLTDGFVYAEANNIADLKKKISENKVAAIMFEAVQGEGGVNALDRDYVAELFEIANENDILLIADEVQIGNGRSGMLYGYMNYGIQPDIFTTAKGLGGGLPIGATVLSEKVSHVYTSGTHGSTFGGNPVCCAGALSIFERLDDELLKGVNERAEYIRKELCNADGIEEVSGLGLMLGITTERPAKDVVMDCIQNGVLVLTAKTKVRLLPALNIPMEDLREAVAILKRVCAAK